MSKENPQQSDEGNKPKENASGGRGLRVVCRIAIIVLLCILLCSALLLACMNTILKGVIEKGGSMAFGNHTTVDTVNLSYFKGSLLIKQLAIGNPEGFDTEHAIYLGNLYVKLDVLSLLKKKVCIQEVSIAEPQVICELGTGGSNIGVLLDNLNKFTGGDSEKSPAAPEEAPRESSSDKQGGITVVIDRVSITGGKVTFATKMLGGLSIPVELPSLTLENLGKTKEAGQDDGISVAEAVKQIVSEMVNAVGKVSGSGNGTGNGGANIGGAMEKISGGIKSLLKK